MTQVDLGQNVARAPVACAPSAPLLNGIRTVSAYACRLPAVAVPSALLPCGMLPYAALAEEHATGLSQKARLVTEAATLAPYPLGVLTPVVLAAAVLCLILWRLWYHYRTQMRRNAAVAEAYNPLEETVDSSTVSIQSLLIRYGMEATGAQMAYLTLFKPEPVVVCHAEGNAITHCLPASGNGPSGRDDMGIQAPLAAREFWSPLMDGETHVLHTGSPRSGDSGYPLEHLPVRQHLAVGLMRGRTPLAVLGMANGKTRFSHHDIRRLRILLSGIWKFVHMCENLDDRKHMANQAMDIINATPFGVALLDDHGTILEDNPAFHDMFAEHGHHRGRSIFSLVPATECLALEDTVTRVLHLGGPPVVHEMEHSHKGTTHFVRISFVRVSAQPPFQVLVIMEDVTEQRKAQQQLETYREQLAQMVLDRTIELKSALVYAESTRDRIDMILRSIADGLFVTDMHNRIILMNHNAEKFLGIALRDAVGMQVGKALGTASFRLLLEERVAQARTGGDKLFAFQVPATDHRQTRYIRAAASPILDKSKAPAGVVTTLHDATQEWKLDTLKSEFLSMAAHELRTPLTNIQGFSDLLLNRRDITEGERERFLRLVNTNAQTLSGIVSDLLDISRIESGKGFSLKLVRVNIGQLTQEIVETWGLRNTASTANHTLSFSGATEDAFALVDKNKYAQILENLLSNAVKYSPNGGNISVTMETDDAIILLTVRDSGMGMTATELERVFEKFFRAHAEDGAIQGTGLGMPIVKHLVEAHGGEIWLESAPDKGTSVSFTLPTADVAAARP